MLGQFLSGEVLRITIFIHLPHLVGTGNHAVAAAHAFGFIHPDNTVFALLGGAGRTDFHAFRVGAVVATHGVYQLGYGGIFPFLADQHPVPENIGWDEMLRLTGQHTGITTDTSLQFYYHSPSHSFFPPTPSNSILWSILLTLTIVAVSWLQHTGQAC